MKNLFDMQSWYFHSTHFRECRTFSGLFVPLRSNCTHFLSFTEAVCQSMIEYLLRIWMTSIAVDRTMCECDVLRQNRIQWMEEVVFIQLQHLVSTRRSSVRVYWSDRIIVIRPCLQIFQRLFSPLTWSSATMKNSPMSLRRTELLDHPQRFLATKHTRLDRRSAAQMKQFCLSKVRKFSVLLRFCDPSTFHDTFRFSIPSS